MRAWMVCRTYVVDFLMRNTAIVLQNVIVLRTRRLHQLLYNWQDLRKLIIRDVGQFLAVGFWNNESVAAGEGLDVEEGEDFVGFVELVGRNVTCVVSVSYNVLALRTAIAEDVWCHCYKEADIPLIILQNIQEAIFFADICVVVKRSLGWIDGSEVKLKLGALG